MSRGPWGVKEIAEGSTMPVLGAVARAIAKATGVWIKDLPITPEKVARALRARHSVGGSVFVQGQAEFLLPQASDGREDPESRARPTRP